MKKTIRKIYLCFIITILFTTGIALGNDTNLENKEYTEIYKQWLELSDEQKENVIEPSKYNFYSKDTKEEIQLANQKMNLKSLVKMAKSSTYATSPKFSLKTLIDNNLEIKDQKSTNFCWAFASISSLETNLALKNYNDNKDDKIYDYSERHMVYSMTQSFKDGQVNTNGWKQKAKDGGTTTMSMAYLTNGSGAINEEDMKFVDSQEEIDINDTKYNTYHWNAIGKQTKDYKQKQIVKERESVFINQNKKNIPDIVCERILENPKYERPQKSCCILDAKYYGWDYEKEAYYLPRNLDIYKQFFYQEQFQRIYEKENETNVGVYNFLVLPDYLGDTKDTKWGIIRQCAVIEFDYHQNQKIAVLQVDIEKLVDFIYSGLDMKEDVLSVFLGNNRVVPMIYGNEKV